MTLSIWIPQLIFSTVLATIALAAARLPMTARSRFVLCAAGLAAFAVPFAAVRAVFRQMSTHTIDLAFVPAGLFIPTADTAAPRFPSSLVLAIVAAGIPSVILIATAIKTISLGRRIADGAVPASISDQIVMQRVAGAMRARSPRIIRSFASDTVFLFGVFRPAIVLPAVNATGLSDSELESLLAHECAHAVRHDNLFMLFERAIGAAFWFHPLVWLLRRRLASSREEACDEMALAVGSPDSLISAISTITRGAALGALPVASCAAPTDLNERIKHIMSYPSLRASAPSHRTILAAAAVLFASFTAVAGAITTQDSRSTMPRYLLTYTMTRTGARTTVASKIVDTQTAAVIGAPVVAFTDRVTTSGSFEKLAWSLDLTAPPAGNGSAVLRISSGDTELQRTSYELRPAAARSVNSKYQGEPISLDLKDASLRDVLGRFATITKIQFVIDPDVEGTVTIRVSDTPWDEVLDRIITESGNRWNLEGGKIHVHK